jgi:hypothetical protein
MVRRVTDLEKFALEEIWRPYQTMKGHERRLEKLPCSLDETYLRLIQDQTGWAAKILARAGQIGFTFPSYIVHPLADLIRVARVAKSATPPNRP